MTTSNSINGNPDNMAALPYLIALGEKLKDAKNLWGAVEILTDALGADVGRHLETLVLNYGLKAANPYE